MGYSAGMTFEIRESTRARNLRIVVHEDGRVVVTKPARAKEGVVRAFIDAREEWIRQTHGRLLRAKERREGKYGKALPVPRLRRGTSAYRAAITQARALAHARVAHFARLGGYTHASISIRNQKTRWGSCSRRGALSFNYRLIYLPPDLLDYLIVHELAHTKHHNHSAAFWKEVEKHIPEPQKKRKELHRYSW